MSILNDIKQEAKKGGSALGKIFWVKSDDKRRVRFITDFEDAVKIPWLNCWDKNINCPNPNFFGKNNPYENDDGVKDSYMYMWQVYDYDSNEVKPFLYKPNQCSPIPHLAVMFETYETICDRDYVINCSGSGTTRTMPVVAMDKAKFRQKVKPLSTSAIKKIISEAYQDNLQGAADDDETEDYTTMKASELYSLCKERDIDDVKFKQPKSYYVKLLEQWDIDNEEDDGYTSDQDDDWDDEETQDYESMKPQELYKLCKERKIECKPKKSKQYYIDLLEFEEEEDDDDWDDEEWEDDDDDDEGGLPWK